MKEINIETGENSPLFIDPLEEFEMRSPRRPFAAPDSMDENGKRVVERMA
jgi:hypothetical protein